MLGHKGGFKSTLQFIPFNILIRARLWKRQLKGGLFKTEKGLSFRGEIEYFYDTFDLRIV